MINTDLLFKLNSFCKLNFMPRRTKHCAKIVRIRSFSGPSFSAFKLNTDTCCKFPYSIRTQENTGQKNLEYGHFLRSVILWELVGYSLISTKSFWNLLNQRRHSALRSVINSSKIISEKTWYAQFVAHRVLYHALEYSLKPLHLCDLREKRH